MTAPVHCAKASDPVETAMAKAKPARIRPLIPGLRKLPMAIIPQINHKKRVEIPILLLGHRTPRLRKAPCVETRRNMDGD